MDEMRIIKVVEAFEQLKQALMELARSWWEQIKKMASQFGELLQIHEERIRCNNSDLYGIYRMDQQRQQRSYIQKYKIQQQRFQNYEKPWRAWKGRRI